MMCEPKRLGDRWATGLCWSSGHHRVVRWEDPANEGETYFAVQERLSSGLWTAGMLHELLADAVSNASCHPA